MPKHSTTKAFTPAKSAIDSADRTEPSWPENLPKPKEGEEFIPGTENCAGGGIPWEVFNNWPKVTK